MFAAVLLVTVEDWRQPEKSTGPLLATHILEYHASYTELSSIFTKNVLISKTDFKIACPLKKKKL